MSRSRQNEPPMPDALAYFLTWTTYGTWLPGDQRGWVRHGEGIQLPNPITESLAKDRMTESAIVLNKTQRAIVESTIRQHCRIRRWELFAVNCRTNHVHVVVAANCHPETVLNQFKAWCTRKLKATLPESTRSKWWTRRGSHRFINHQTSLEAAIVYTIEAQDQPR